MDSERHAKIRRSMGDKINEIMESISGAFSAPEQLFFN